MDRDSQSESAQNSRTDPPPSRTSDATKQADGDDAERTKAPRAADGAAGAENDSDESDGDAQEARFNESRKTELS